MKTRWLNTFALVAAAVAAALVVVGNTDRGKSSQLLNVSYDPTRELFVDLNRQFIAKYENDTGRKLTIKQSHGGSSRQARAVIDGLDADVVTLALYSDVDALRKQGLLPDGWAKRLPHDSAPWTSTIVFVVRKGNPLHIRDWPDLAAPDVSVITPNPKTSGNGKLSLLGAWGSVIYRGGSEPQARDYLRRLYANVPVLDTGARGAATTFADEKVGDVHLTWENEALREVEDSKGELEIVYPPVSILAEPSVAWVDGNVSRRKTAASAQAYLQFLYTAPAQETMAGYGYRPIDPEILKKHADRLPKIDLFPVTILAKDWDDAQQKFFAENGIFDAIYKPKATP
ncbi:MAG TPA: sulfate ABC transporter substrate-binding protein [Bryobacteraceae bacterium]|jgi:sulfate/thiosulfate transport system substrate-binding protein|nr:sulfate ABC transporter substrate-binding protein [Bryobacteraceae bacterium]